MDKYDITVVDRYDSKTIYYESWMQNRDLGFERTGFTRANEIMEKLKEKGYLCLSVAGTPESAYLAVMHPKRFKT